MLRDAEAHAEEDRRRREEAEVRNTADTLVYRTERLLKDQGAAAPAEQRQLVEDGLGSLKSALAGNDVADIRAATQALSEATQRLTQHLYEQASAHGQGYDSAGGDDDVVDAEIVDERRSA